LKHLTQRFKEELMAVEFSFQNRGVSFASVVISAIALTSIYPATLAAQAAKPATHRPPPTFHFVQPEPINFDDHEGWTQIFDG
jgi:hypothetical protein